MRLLEPGHFGNPMKHPYHLWHLNPSEHLTPFSDLSISAVLGDLMEVPRSGLMREES